MVRRLSPKLIVFIFPFLSILSSIAQTTFIGGGGNNNWNTPTNWSAGIPTIADDVIISDGVTVDVTVDAQCASLTYSTNTSTTTINILSGITLTAAGDVNFGVPTVDAANQILNVDDGSLVCDNIFFPNTGNNNRDDQLWLSDGSITVTGSIKATENNGQRNYVDCSPGGVNGTGTITVGGDFYSTDNGAFFDRGNSTVVYNGVGNQIIGNFVYYNLQLNGNGNKSLLGNITLNNGATLTLTNGVLDLNGYYIYLDRTFTIAGSFSATSMIDFQNGGFLYIRSNSSNDLEWTYPIGIGANFNPLTLSNVANDVNGTLRIYLYPSKHPLTSGTNNCLTKYVSLVSTDLIGTEYDVNFNYSDSDIPGVESNLDEAGLLTSTGWLTSTSNPANIGYNHSSNTISLTNITSWGDLTLGESSGCFDGILPDKYTIAPGNWNTGAIWNNGTVPVAGDNVAILHSTVTLNVSPTIGNLVVMGGGDLYLNTQNLTVQGTTEIYGQIRDTRGTNGLVHSFQDKVTVYDGGTYYCPVDYRTYTFQGGIENNGTFQITNPSNVTIDFITASQVISGNGITQLDGAITIASGLTLTNQVSEPTNGLIIEGVMNGSDATSTFVTETVVSFQNNAASFATAGTFDANSTANNTVQYNGAGNQNIIPANYENLITSDGNSNNSSNTLTGTTIVNGDFTIESLSYFDPMGNDLTVNGNSTISGVFDDDDAAGITSLQDVDLSNGSINGGAFGVVNINGTLSLPTGNATIGRAVVTTANTVTIPNSRTLTISSNQGSKTFNNLIVENGGAFTNTNENIEFTGNLTVENGATFTQGTGTYTFSGANKEINGTIPALTFNNLAVTGTLTSQIDALTINNTTTVTAPGTFTNNDTYTVNTATLAGTGNFIQGINSNLYISTNATITTLTASANGNLVEYTSAGNENVVGATYYNLTVRNGNAKTLTGDAIVNGDFNIATLTYFDPMANDLTVNGNTIIAGIFDDDAFAGTTNLQDVDLSGGQISGNQAGVVNINGNLTMPTGDGAIGYVVLTVNGNTTVADTRTLSITSNAGSKTFGGAVLIDGPTGNWVNTNENIELQNGIEFNGATFTSGTGTYSFTTNAAQSISGTSAMLFSGTVSVGAGVNLTNNNSEAISGVTINGALSGVDGTSTFTNESILNYNNAVEPMLTGILDADATGNVFQYSRGDNQNVAGVIYDNLIFSNSGNKTLQNTTTVNDSFTASGSINTITGANNLTLSGPVIYTTSGNFTTGSNIVTYNRLGDQDIINGTYGGQLLINGTGIKTLLGDATVSGAVNISGGDFGINSNVFATSSSITIGAGASLNVNDNAQLLLSNGQTLTNNGMLSVVGSVGNEAIVSINGAGNYSIVQPTAGAEINAQYYQFNYLNNGIVISDGTINSTNNFSNGAFSNGTGSQYIEATGIDASLLANISNTVFNAGPTYNVVRTSGTGSLTFEDGSGAIAGENFDSDNGNPGTLINWEYPSSTYYSNPLGTFSAGTLTDWTRNPDGSGGSPSSLSDGLATLIVQDGHTVTLNNVGGDIDVLALQVGEGSSGIFRIGEDGTQRTVTIQEKLEVLSGALVNVVSTGSPSHILVVNGNLVNDGTINLRATASNVANVQFNGSSSLVSGTNAPIFNDIVINSGANVSASVSLNIENNIILEDNSVFQDGGLTHTVGGNWIANGTATLIGGGTIEFDGIVNTIEDGTAANFTFNNIKFSGGVAASIQENITLTGNLGVYNNTTCSVSNYLVAVEGGFELDMGSTYLQTANNLSFTGTNTQNIIINGSATFYNLVFNNGGANAKSIVGDFSASNRVTISSGATVDGGGSYSIIGGLRIDGTCNFSGIVTLKGNYLFTYNASNSLTLGTAELNIEGNVGLTYGGSATSLLANINNNVNINSGYLRMPINTSMVGQPGNTFTATDGSALLVEGADNFPTGFGTYALQINSRVEYQGADQTVRGNVTYGNLRVEISGTKTVDGPVDVDGQLQLYDNIILDLQNYNHTFASDIINEAGTCTITGNNANVTLDADDATQTVQAGIYSFKDLNITLNAGTSNITKTFSSGSTIDVFGDFNISNVSGSPSVVLTVNYNDNGIGGTPNNFTLGNYCQFNTTHPTFGAAGLDSFSGTKTLNQNSVFYYSLNGTQSVADGVTYGHLTFNGGNKTAEGGLDINGDIYRTTNTPVFYDGGFTHNLQGNWLLNNSAWYTQASATGKIVFDGTDQEIQGVNFNDVTINNTGTVTQQTNIIIYGDLTVENGGSLDANIRNINIGGDWLVNPTGLFIQTLGTTTFDGSSNQTLTSNNASSFGRLTINKPNAVGNQTVTLLSELHIDDNFTMNANAGVFDISNQNVYFSKDFYVYNNTVEAGSPFISTNSTVYFNGGDAQNIKNYDLSDLSFNNIVFTGSGDKTLDYENSIPSSRIFDINGDVTINGATVSANGFGDGGVDLTVAGDWNNTGSFSHGTARTVTFDGADQNISSSSFGNLDFSGTNTKTLQGNITLSASLTIESGVTLNANNNNISLAGIWDNDAIGSIFLPTTSTVTFEGNAAEIFAGTGAGKNFYNLVVNMNTGRTVYMRTDIDIDNNLSISSGYLRTQDNNIEVGGDFVVSGGVFNQNNDASRLTLNATSGTKLFDPGASGTIFRGMTINAPGATYTVQNEFTVSRNQDFILTDGYFDLNGNTMTVVSNNHTIYVNGGTFDIDEGATVSFSSWNQQIQVNGGVFRLVGTFASNANLTRTGGTYSITQNSGTFHAQYYRAELCSGINISGGSIDATNNFSNGTFTNGVGSSYINLTGLNFTDFTATNVVFNSGPTYNVSRTSGTGTITLEDSFGSLAGEGYDQDDGNPGTLIEWSFPTGFFWDGGDLTDNEDWHRADNWSGNTVPTSANLVILNHDFLATPYTVRIKTNNAEVYRLMQDEQGTGNAIDLILENGFNLKVNENLSIGNNTSITQTDNTNIIHIGQNFVNDGVLNNGNSTVYFDGPAGSFSIESGGNGVGKSFYDIVFDATDATYLLSNVLDVDNDLTIIDGTFDLGTNTNDITVGGNWTIDMLTGGAFLHSNADVTFDGVNQSIQNGSFYNFITSNSGTKQLASNIDVDNDMVIGLATILDAQEFTIYIGDDWINNGGFSQTGLGEVVFDGTQGQNIDNGATGTDFNYLSMSNSGTKTFYNNSNVHESFIVNSGSGVIDLNTYTVTGVGGANTFILNGTMFVRGANNFPSGFETISLASNSVVDYLGTIDQTIYSTTYGNLRLRSLGSTTTKTAAGDLVILGYVDLDNDAQTTLDMSFNDANMTIAGNIYAIGDDIQWGTGNATLIHNGVYWNIDPDLVTFNHMNLSGTGNKWMNGNLNVTGNVTVQNGVSLRMYRNNDRSQGRTMTGVGSNTFTVDNGGRCICAIAAGTGPAIPNNFSTYNLADNSDYYLYSSAGIDQILYTGNSITYGNLYFSEVKNVTSDGIATLDVNGIFDMNNSTYIDNGQDMNLAGAYVYFTNYTPSANTVTVNLDGLVNQRISDDLNNTIDIGTLICSGSATKTLCDGNDILNIAGDFSVTPGVDVTSTEIINFSGANWVNNGTFRHTAQTLSFVGAVDQFVNPGVSNPSNYFNNVYFNNANTVTFNTNGADINGSFTINNGTVDLGALDYTIQGSITNTSSTLISNLSNITLDGGNQNVNTPAFSVNDITTSGSGTKRLFSDWAILGDLTINSGTALNTSDNVSPTYYDINIAGNWTNAGTFVDNTSTVNFNGSVSPITITSGGSNFYDVVFSPSVAVTYTLASPSTRFARAMDLGSNATLNLNSKTLILGSYISSGKLYTVDGNMIVNENATLQFNNRLSQSVMNVSGTLQVIGVDASNIAVISRDGTGVAGSETQINILNGGTLAAQYYLIEYLQDNGLVMQSGSILDAVNNLSNGTWSNIRNAANVCYINMECDYAGGNITNITFNYSGTPVSGTHYNVRRNLAATAITFDNVSGNLGTYLYEDDEEAIQASATGLLRWPAITESYWTGAINSDWHNPGNWDNGVPTSLVDAIIPNRANDPRIYNGDAECKNLEITDGVLILDADNRLDALGDVTIGTSTNVGILSVNTVNSVIAVGGFWTRGINGIFNHGNGTVIFNSSAGSSTILPRTSNFYKVQFNNALTNFYLSGSSITFEGDFEVLNGTVTPVTNNYTYYMKGDFLNTGTFTPTLGGVSNGTVEFNGAVDQNITGGTFHRMNISGTGNKIVNGPIDIANLTTINSTLVANTGSSIDFNGDVVINVGGTFNDGGEAHTFTGVNWTGDGAYTGTGKITFDRTNSNQNIYGGTFYNLNVNCIGRSLDLFGDVTINNNLILLSGVNDMDLNTFQITNSSGIGTYTQEDNVFLYVSGANNFPVNFATYDLGANTRVYYNGTIDQIIAPVEYGHLYLYNPNTKTLSGDIAIQGNIYFNNDPTLDVTANNYNITIAGHWDNNNSNGIFIPHGGEVKFNGNSSNQGIYIGTLASNEFYDLTVSNTGGYNVVASSNVTYTIQNNLHVESGNFNPNSNSRIIYVGGDLLATATGSFSTTGNYYLNSSNTGVRLFGVNGSRLLNVTIESTGNATYIAQDNITIVDDFRINSGTFNGNGKIITLGNGTSDIVSIVDTYQMGAGGAIALGNGTTLTVESGGSLDAVGSLTNVVNITNNASGGRYNFIVNGTIAAEYYVFQYMSSTGIYLSPSSVIDATNHFSNGTFTNGANTGQLFRVENTQGFSGANRIENVTFPVNPGGSAANVTKNSTASGILEFYNATGAFAGETYDLDPNDLINWTGPITLTWNGSVSTDWNNASNWTASSGPGFVPTGAEDVIIATAVNQPILTTFGAITGNLTINNGATLIINTPLDAAATDLDVNGDLNIVGTLRLNTINDYIAVEGSWTKTGNVILNGNVTFDGSGGAKTINNANVPFYNLNISGTSIYQLRSNTTINNDLTIDAGATLDVTATDYSINIYGDWINNGAFYAQEGKVTFTATSGSRNILGGTSAFNDIEIIGGSATYTLSGNLSVKSDLNLATGTLDMNGQELNMGDGTNTDYFTITGTFIVDENASLKMGANASVNVNSGGTINVVGTDAANVATVTRQTTGNYSFDVNSGGTINAQYYLFEYMDADGIYVHNGAAVGSANDFSNGTFSNGFASGASLKLEHDVAISDYINNVIFNSGSAFNVSRKIGTNQIYFVDASGPIGSYLYELDELGVPDAGIGLLRWSYLNTNIWDGDQGDNDWHNPDNWTNGTVPDLTKNVIIPDVTYDPIIFNGAAEAKRVSLDANASLTINNKDLSVVEEFYYNGDVIAMGTPTITVGDNWTRSSGTFTPGNSTVILSALSGTRDINIGSDSFYNLEINSSGAYRLNENTLVENNVNIISGTLNSNDYDLTIGGSWANTGVFVEGTRTVTFNSNSGTSSIDNNSDSFYNLVVNSGNGSGTGVFVLNANLDISNDLTITKGTLDLSNNGGTTSNNLTVDNRFLNTGGNLLGRSGTIQVGENWLVNGTGQFTCGTGTVNLVSNAGTRTVDPGGSDFYNLNISGSAIFRISENTLVENNLNISNGTLDVSSSPSYTLTVNGDWTNTAAFNERNGTVILGGGNQTITNPGGETFYRLTLNNTSLTQSNGNINITNTFNFDAGNVNTNGYRVILGTNTSNVGVLNYVSGTIIGEFKRWVNALGTDYVFPVGTVSQTQKATLRFLSGLTPGALAMNFVGSAPGTTGLPLTDAGYNIDNTFSDGYWNSIAENSFACTDYNVILDGTGFSTYTVEPETRVLKRNNGGNWTLDGTHSAGSPPLCYRNGVNGISTSITQFCLGVGACTGGTIAHPDVSICEDDDPLAFTNPESPAGGTGYTYTWQFSAVLTAVPGDANWTDIAATNTLTYDPPSLSNSTIYVRKAVATSGCAGAKYSNTITIDVTRKPNTGSVYHISNTWAE